MDTNYYLQKEGVTGLHFARYMLDFWQNDKSYFFIKSKRMFLQSPVADFGCGQGPLTILTARLGLKVVGFDCIEENVFNGEALRIPSDTADFVRAFLDSIPAKDDSFSSGICKEVLEHIVAPDLPAILGEMRRVLKPGASLIVTAPKESLNSPLDPLQHVTFFHSPSELAQLLANNGFSIRKKEFNRTYQRICVVAENQK